MSVNISVIIPVHNRAAMLKRAVKSVLAQTYKDFELIVVDDGSTEDLLEVRSLVEQNGHCFLVLEKNLGVAVARNFGIKQAKGRWLALLDSDDVWLPEKLEKQIQFLEKNPELRIMQSQERWYRGGEFVNPRYIHQMPEGEEVFYRSLKLCCISSSSVVFEKFLFDEMGGYDEQLWVCEDYDLWLRISAKYQVGLLKEVLAEKFAGHEDQLSKSTPAMDRFRVFALLKLLDEAELSEKQINAVVKEINKKSSVLYKGAVKRGNEEYAKVYGELLDVTAGA